MALTTEKSILLANILIVICSIFYLAWWTIAFKPVGAIKGLTSGWLLIPAAITGCGFIAVLVSAVQHAETSRRLIPNGALLAIGVLLYILLLAVTYFGMNRIVTTELILIVGWCMLTIAEANTLYGIGRFSAAEAIVWVIVTVIVAAASLICYLLYYGLDAVKGYIDGMLPLLFVGIQMLILTVRIAV